MRQQAFVPEAPARLEGRCLPSSPRAPIVFAGTAFGSILSRMRADFGEYVYAATCRNCVRNCGRSS